MVISHKYKFIFIKTRKTAGTSVEVELNKILEPDDVATPIRPKVNGHFPQNIRYGKGKNEFFFNHISANTVRSIVGDKIFNDYFVFCVEREPVDKCISHYSMATSYPYNVRNNFIGLTFDKYLERNLVVNDFDKYTNDAGELIIDKIIKYENLKEELSKISANLGFDFELNAREKVILEKISLSDDQIKTIYKLFSNSNQITGYSIDNILN